MNRTEFEATIRTALDELPDWVQEAMENIEVIVIDEPGRQLDPQGQRLLGLYMGVPLPERGADYVGELPDVIYIFRCPHLELGLPPDKLRDEMTKTLMHEIAHYFGIDDDHLDKIGWS